MTIELASQVELSGYTTIGVPARARWALEVTKSAQLVSALQAPPAPPLILGGGSNVLPLGDLDRMVLFMRIEGRAIVEHRAGDQVIVQFGAGENWDSIVDWCLDHELYGIENLALIPGTVGAAPIQNIGAYGVEFEEFFESLEAVDCETGATRRFRPEDCEFGYRDSFFKRAGRDRYAITAVRLRLSRRPRVRTNYGAIHSVLEAAGIADPSPRQVAETVRQIRRSKLPDPARIGNAGSFFKNPVIPAAQATALQAAHPKIPIYPAGEQHAKLAAGWLIEQAGFKGLREGGAGCHAQQALVLVNHGGATGRELLALSERIQAAVQERFQVQLEREVRVLSA